MRGKRDAVNALYMYIGSFNTFLLVCPLVQMLCTNCASRQHKDNHGVINLKRRRDVCHFVLGLHVALCAATEHQGNLRAGFEMGLLSLCLSICFRGDGR